MVDDEPGTAELTARLVRGWGHTTAVAGDGATALTTAAEFRPNVVLLDLSLPDRHGYEVAKQLRDQAQGRPLLLVAVSGWGQVADHQGSAAAGIFHHLVKPVNAAALEQILASYQAAEERRAGGGDHPPSTV